jgi:sugar phosphate permease
LLDKNDEIAILGVFRLKRGIDKKMTGFESDGANNRTFMGLSLGRLKIEASGLLKNEQKNK